MSKVTTIYLVRHGQSVYNRDNVLSGHDDPALTDEGKKQARALAEKLSDIKFDEIYTSDMRRAFITAELISGRPVPKTRQLTQLRERDFGKLEGKSVQLWLEMHRAEGYQKLSEEQRWTFKHRPDIETEHSVSERYEKAIEELAKQHPGKTILIVAHGGALRALLIRLGYATMTELPPGVMQNTSYAKLIYEGHKLNIAEVVGVNKPADIL